LHFWAFSHFTFSCTSLLLCTYDTHILFVSIDISDAKSPDQHLINQRCEIYVFWFFGLGLLDFGLRYQVFHCALWLCEWLIVISFSFVSGAQSKLILQEWQKKPERFATFRKAAMKPKIETDAETGKSG